MAGCFEHTLCMQGALHGPQRQRTWPIISGSEPAGGSLRHARPCTGHKPKVLLRASTTIHLGMQGPTISGSAPAAGPEGLVESNHHHPPRHARPRADPKPKTCEEPGRLPRDLLLQGVAFGMQGPPNRRSCEQRGRDPWACKALTYSTTSDTETAILGQATEPGNAWEAFLGGPGPWSLRT